MALEKSPLASTDDSVPHIKELAVNRSMYRLTWPVPEEGAATGDRIGGTTGSRRPVTGVFNHRTLCHEAGDAGKSHGIHGVSRAVVDPRMSRGGHHNGFD